jgi:hypothetical protein
MKTAKKLGFKKKDAYSRAARAALAVVEVC